MIDPGIWESEQVHELTSRQFKLYVFLISSADDEGRFKANPKMIASSCFPLDEDYTSKECAEDLESMGSIGLIRLYSVGNRPYGLHPNWTEYQYIQKPKKSKIPLPEEYDTSTVLVTEEYDTSITPDEIPVSPNRIEENRIEERERSLGSFVKIPEHLYESLVEDFGEEVITDYAERVDLYCQSKGKRYKDYSATIRNWLKRDGVQKRRKVTPADDYVPMDDPDYERKSKERLLREIGA